MPTSTSPCQHSKLRNAWISTNLIGEIRDLNVILTSISLITRKDEHFFFYEVFIPLPFFCLAYATFFFKFLGIITMLTN